MENNGGQPIIVVAGPTASGKSTLALTIAQHLNGEIINADSMQIYREFQVLTARPGAREQALVPHHLYGALGAIQACSAGRWLKMVLQVIAEVRTRGRLPIVCGGTGLYIKALMEGIASIPPVPKNITEMLQALYDKEGGYAFWNRLAQLDPVSASKLHRKDRQRLIRAYGVVKETGFSIVDWQNKQTPGAPIEGHFSTILLSPLRDALYQRINERFDQMLIEGAITEVASILEKEFDPNLPAMNVLGFKDLSSFLAGDCDLDEAATNAKRATRNFAKRQLTWFRNKMPDGLVVEDFGDKNTIFNMVKPFLDKMHRS